MNKIDHLEDNSFSKNRLLCDSPKHSLENITSTPETNLFGKSALVVSNDDNQKTTTEISPVLKEEQIKPESKPETAKQTKHISSLFDDDNLYDQIFHVSDQNETEASKTIEHSNNADLPAEDKKQPIKLFTDSDDELFSTITSVKVTKETNATSNSSHVAQSSIERNKMAPKLFTDSDEETLFDKNTDSNNAQSVQSKIVSKTVSKLFSESDEEIFATPKEVDIKKEGNNVIIESVDEIVTDLASVKTENKVMSDSNVAQPSAETNSSEKNASKLFNESDEDIFTNVSKSIAKKKSSRLFGSDDDSDGELFQNSKSRAVEQKSSGTKTIFPKLQEHSKKGLFDDSSSDDDLFSSGNKNGKSPGRFKIFFFQDASDCANSFLNVQSLSNVKTY